MSFTVEATWVADLNNTDKIRVFAFDCSDKELVDGVAEALAADERWSVTVTERTETVKVVTLS